MDPNTTVILILIGAAIVIGAICWFGEYLGIKEHNEDAIFWINLAEKEKDSNNWDEEFLRAEAKKHKIDRIEPMKYFYKSNKSKKYDGYRYICTCGHKDFRMSLDWAEIGFNKHVKEMREVALAELGRFK